MDAFSQLGLFYKEEAVKEATLADPILPRWHSQEFFALDVETTGLDPAADRIIELALVPFNRPQSDSFSSLFSLGEDLPPEITRITGITDDMLRGQPSFKEKADEILALMEKAPFIVAYNAKFDRPFVESEFARINKAVPEVPWIDPYVFICEFDRFKKGKKLVDATKRWGVTLGHAHRAFDDAKAAGDLLLKLVDTIGLNTLEQVIERQKIWFWQNAHNLAQYKKASTWEVNR